MSEHDKIAIAARLHVLMRRLLGRVTDVEWMVASPEYARELVRLARAAPHAELHEWAGKLEAAVVPRPAPPSPEPVLPPPVRPQRYVLGVRG